MQTFISHSNKGINQFLVEFDQAERFNSLISETWCPLPQRLIAAKEPAQKKIIRIICKSEQGAIEHAKYHFYSSGSNFKIAAR